MAATTLVVGGCVSLNQLGARNRQRLSGLEIGMTKSDVQRVMGTDTTSVREYGRSTQVIPSPYKTATVQTDRGQVLEVLYYYTGDLQGDPRGVRPDDITPVVLTNGRVSGWGSDFFESVDKHELRVR
jgi:hypothetical protein